MRRWITLSPAGSRWVGGVFVCSPTAFWSFFGGSFIPLILHSLEAGGVGWGREGGQQPRSIA